MLAYVLMSASFFFHKDQILADEANMYGAGALSGNTDVPPVNLPPQVDVAPAEVMQAAGLP